MGNESILDDASRSVDESNILDAIASGDHAALRKLYFLYYPCLARLLTGCTSGRNCVEAMIIETFRVIWETASTTRRPAEMSTWILGIAYAVARQTLGTEQRASIPTATNALDHQRSADAAIYRLPLEQRITFLLAYQLGLSLEAIAEITRCPHSMVAVRMADAREAIRRAPTNFNHRAAVAKRPALHISSVKT
jgi:RNA polymerase sigma-70 factor, ECF subfamily